MDPSAANALLLGREWLAAWNARDLERVLKLYADDAQMSSEIPIRLGLSPHGVIRGKANLRAYWTKALAQAPDLHFTPLGFFASPDSLVVHYRNERGRSICEYLRIARHGADAGLIVQGSANHLIEGDGT